MPINNKSSFSTTLSGVIQLCTLNNKYIDITTATGINIIYLRDIDTIKIYITPTTPSGITSSYVNNTYLFYGTTYTGINYTCLSGIDDINDNTDYTSNSYNFASEPYITSNYVKYTHCNDKYVICCTESGVDCYDITTTSGYWYYTTFSGAQKCFVLNDDAYYTTKSGSYASVVIIKDIPNNWDIPYKTYDNSGSSTFDEDITIYDLFVENGVGYNTIYCATSSGIYAINEDTGYADVYLTTSG